MSDLSQTATKSDITLVVNGKAVTVRAFAMERLLDVLRHTNWIDGHQGRLWRRRVRFVFGVGGWSFGQQLPDTRVASRGHTYHHDRRPGLLTSVCTRCNRLFSIVEARSAAFVLPE